ncbi:glycosyltransferase family 32 protein [Clostridium paraputrificum]|uniref:glycosyltransferase family 32 protein n=1 Tax=Clostridium paraputrificum TaxID=29363 RepID=UPI003D32F652
MIPKVINYCWFGGNPLPPLAVKCIDSWKKFCPDYKIIEWNESNFDLDCCDYVREAYKEKKWAFVSDYARFKILYENGGLYFDTDVELIKPLDDILSCGSFMGVENFISSTSINPGLGLAVVPGLGLYKELLDSYHDRHFINKDGSLNLTTVVDYTTECLRQHGLKDVNVIQEVAGVYIYPKEYFNPTDMDTGKIIVTDNTVSIHHYAASWVDSYSIFRGKVYSFIAKFMGKSCAEKIRKIVGRK